MKSGATTDTTIVTESKEVKAPARVESPLETSKRLRDELDAIERGREETALDAKVEFDFHTQEVTKAAEALATIQAALTKALKNQTEAKAKVEEAKIKVEAASKNLADFKSANENAMRLLATTSLVGPVGMIFKLREAGWDYRHGHGHYHRAAEFTELKASEMCWVPVGNIGQFGVTMFQMQKTPTEREDYPRVCNFAERDGKVTAGFVKGLSLGNEDIGYEGALMLHNLTTARAEIIVKMNGVKDANVVISNYVIPAGESHVLVGPINAATGIDGKLFHFCKVGAFGGSVGVEADQVEVTAQFEDTRSALTEKSPFALGLRTVVPTVVPVPDPETETSTSSYHGGFGALFDFDLMDPKRGPSGSGGGAVSVPHGLASMNPDEPAMRGGFHGPERAGAVFSGTSTQTFSSVARITKFRDKVVFGFGLTIFNSVDDRTADPATKATVERVYKEMLDQHSKKTLKKATMTDWTEGAAVRNRKR